MHLTLVMAHTSDVNLDDKISTYRWFVAGMRYVVLAHIAALIFGALWFFTDSGFVFSAIVGLAVVAMGYLIVGRPSEAALHQVPGTLREH